MGASYDLSAHQTLSRVVILIKENYVDPERIRPYEMFMAALDHIEKAVAEVIVDSSQAPRQVTVHVGDNEHVFDLERLGGLDQLWEVTLALRDIFRFIQRHITDPAQRREIEYAAINGMLSSLDPHSVLLKPESFDEVKLSTKGEFGGLGIVISIRDAALTIISPIEGTPAARAGLKARDQIVRIGEESTINMGLDEAVNRLRGKPGTKVNIWVLRKGWTEPKRFALTRAVIKIESVASETLEGGIGYLKIKSFQSNTFEDLDAHLERLRQKNNGRLKGLVLDLRNNPGGLLDQAILVSDRFIAEGPLVITVGEGNRKRDVKSAHASGTDTNYPIAVLVNGGSASASEIVSGALKNHDRAVVIGQQTFGKGSVQVLYDFKDKSALKLTIAQYLTPGDLSIQSVGITPDVEIVPATISETGTHLFVDDDSPREKDLDRHLETPGGSVATSTEPAGLEPVVSILHLAPPEAPAAEDGEAAEETPETFTYDFETRLAHDMLVQSTSLSRPDILRDAGTLFETRAKEEEQRISDKLGAMGVDWGTGPATGSPRADVTLQVKGAKGGVITAGTTAVFTATVRNSGTGPLYRLYGVTASGNPLFKNLEFVFGKVGPGHTRSWDVTIKVPQDIAPRADAIALTLGDLHKLTTAVEAKTTIVLGELPKPHFSYSFRIDDRNGGNGDGVLQLGEQVDFKVDVENLGPGKAEEAMVSLKNLASEAVYLKHGRDEFGVLKAGATKSATLKFQLREPAEEVELRVSIWDQRLGEYLSEAVTLPVAAARRAKLERKTVRAEATEGVPIFAGAADTMPVMAHAKAGVVLRSDASFGKWLRVQLDSGAVGFVRSDDVASAAGQRKVGGALKMAPPQAAPLLTLALPALITSEPSLRISGSVKDERQIKDVFVFVNDKKVFYRSLAALPKTEQGVEASLDIVLPLKVGSNTVAVMARETDDLMSRQIFGVYREAVNAVAEASTERRVPQ